MTEIVLAFVVACAAGLAVAMAFVWMVDVTTQGGSMNDPVVPPMPEVKKRRIKQLASELRTAQGADFDKLIQETPTDDIQAAWAMIRDGVSASEVLSLWLLLRKNWPWIVAIITLIGGVFGGAALAPVVNPPAPNPKVDPTPFPKPKPDPEPIQPPRLDPLSKLTLEVPAEVVAEIGGKPASIVAKSMGRIEWPLPPDCKVALYKTSDGVDLVPFNGATDFSFPVVAVNTNGDALFKWIKVKIKGGQGPQPPPDPPVVDDKRIDRIFNSLALIDKRLTALEKVTPPEPPKPKPPEPITAQSLWVVVVEETADATQARLTFWADEALNARLKAKGHRKRVLDKDTVAKDGKPGDAIKSFLDRAAGKTLPYLVITDLQGSVMFEGARPQTPALLIELLERLGG